MKNLLQSALGYAILSAVAFGTCAQAETFTLSFTNLSTSLVGNTNPNSAIATYIDSALAAAGCSGCSATVSGAYVDSTYTADGNVVGPNGTPDTLGNVNGADSPFNNASTPLTAGTYTYLATTDQNNTGDTDSQISITFTGLSVASVSFDYEIFPDASCTSLTSCGSYNSTTGTYAEQPSFEFTTGSGAGTNVFTQYGVAPKSTCSAPCTDLSSGSDGNSTKDGSTTISAPQYLGTWSGSVSNVSELNFVDWPATIAIDNLTITTTTLTSTPEPASVALLGTVFALVLFSLRRRMGSALR